MNKLYNTTINRMQITLAPLNILILSPTRLNITLLNLKVNQALLYFAKISLLKNTFM